MVLGAWCLGKVYKVEGVAKHFYFCNDPGIMKKDSFFKVEITSQKELIDWLHKNHNQKESVWLVTYKKNTPEKYVSVGEVLDGLLSFGWIDGRRMKLDETRTMQLISPRKALHWTKTYKDRAAKLITEGKMHKSGLKTIEDSKLNGLWNFMDDIDNLIVPEDLLQGLSRLEGAAKYFNSINPSSKRFVLRWIKLSKTNKTRKKRINKIVELSSKRKKLPGS